MDIHQGPQVVASTETWFRLYMLKMKRYFRNWKPWKEEFETKVSIDFAPRQLGPIICSFAAASVCDKYDLKKGVSYWKSRLLKNASTGLPVFCWCSCGHHCLGSTGWNWKRLGTDTKVTIRTDCAHGLSGWVAHCCAESMTALLRQKKETNIKTSLRNAPPKFDSSTLRSKHLQRIIFQPSF